MNVRKVSFAAALICALSTFAASPATAVAQDTAAPEFDAAGFAPYMKPGQGRIDGKLVVAVAGHGASPTSGARIACYPALPYAKWSLTASAARINHTGDTGDASTGAADDARLERYARVTWTDANGEFHFGRIPRGRYLLRATLVTAFPRVVRDVLPDRLRAVYDTPPPSDGQVVYDHTRAWFQTGPLYVGLRAPDPPAFHLVARHDTFDPRR